MEEWFKGEDCRLPLVLLSPELEVYFLNTRLHFQLLRYFRMQLLTTEEKDSEFSNGIKYAGCNELLMKFYNSWFHKWAADGSHCGWNLGSD